MRHLLLSLAIFALTVSAALAQGADVLMVDDAGAATLEAFYGPLCVQARRTYQQWNVAQAGTVPATTLDAYKTVVWLTGHNAAPAGIEGGPETLAGYMDRGGRVLLIGNHAGTAAGFALKKHLGLEIKRFNKLLGQMKGKLPDVIARGRTLELVAPGAETAEIPEYPAALPEVVFWSPDRGVSRYTAARTTGLVDKSWRSAWFGFELSGTKDAAKAGDVFTRALLWVTPEPPAKQKFQKLYKAK